MRIHERFNGPPGSAHGGVACGTYAAAIDPMCATVRLIAPPPLGRDLVVRTETDGSASVLDDDRAIAMVRPWDPPNDYKSLPPATADQLAAARASYLATVGEDGSGHAFPTCFGCGPSRPDGDGLALCPGPLPDSDLYGASWTPTGRPGSTIEPWMVWAAIDCPSAAGPADNWVDLEAGEVLVLGELSVNITELPTAGTRYQVISRPREKSGQRMLADVAVVAEDGSNVASGLATWIHLPSIPGA